MAVDNERAPLNAVASEEVSAKGNRQISGIGLKATDFNLVRAEDNKR